MLVFMHRYCKRGRVSGTAPASTRADGWQIDDEKPSRFWLIENGQRVAAVWRDRDGVWRENATAAPHRSAVAAMEACVNISA